VRSIPVQFGCKLLHPSIQMAIGLSRGTSSLMTTQMPCVPFRFMVTVGEFHRHEVVIGLRVLAEGCSQANLVSGGGDHVRPIIWKFNTGGRPFIKRGIGMPNIYECIGGEAWSVTLTEVNG
jgi:hypothetical protein